MRLAAIEDHLGKLAAELGSLASALDARPTPPPREQERFAVDEKPAAAKPKPKPKPKPKRAPARKKS